jgi:hypothetical protein
VSLVASFVVPVGGSVVLTVGAMVETVVGASGGLKHSASCTQSIFF